MTYTENEMENEDGVTKRESKYLANYLAVACLSLAMAAIVVLSGCAAIPADQDRLPQQDVARTRLAGDIKLASEGWPEAKWWTGYNDAQLNGLIKHALSNGPTLEMAAARIGAARQALAFSTADRQINVGVDAGANRQRYSSNGLFPAPIGGAYYTEETVRLQATYQFDWWGKHRARIASALGEVNARRADYAMAEQTLAAGVAQSYFSLQNGWARVAKLKQLAVLQQALLDDKARRIAHGLANADETQVVKAELASVRQQIESTEAQNGREREALRALLGDPGGNDGGEHGDTLAELEPRALVPAKHALPAKLGMELLARRADLQAAHWRVEAALSNIDAARAAFYPDIDLTGAIGLDAIKLSRLLESGSRTPFIGPTLSLPLFDSGRLGASLGQARSERNEMIADYNQSVFNAVRDVAQAGLYLKGIDQQLAEQADMAQATAALQRTAQARFRQGLANRSATLNADVDELVQEYLGLQLQGQQLTGEVALVKALGGGYRSGLPAQAAGTSAAKAGNQASE
ncbi:MAG TPA: efflux transporter outer membrane subunit [Janthinobacterium sp.]|nr:efflux transporter outer membrane subunit [Janthinobacterium sp.]